MIDLRRIAYYAHVFYTMKTHAIITRYMPEYVAIEVTNACNFKCAFCPQSDPKHHEIVPRTYLSEEQCELFLGKIRASGIRTNLMHWTLDGEPFMHKNFHRLCEIGVAYGFTNSHFASNGMLCTAEQLLKFPIDKCRFNIAIDFCADKEYFEQVRGTEKSWERVNNNVTALLTNENLSNVHIEMTDISSFSIADKNKLAQNFSRLKELFPKNQRITFRPRTFHNATGYLNAPGKVKTKYHLCPYVWTTLRIASNGDVVACCRDLQHKTVLGNLHHEEISEIWNGPRMQQLRRNLVCKRPDLSRACRDCDLPHDKSKFTFRNVLRAAKGRIQFFR